MTENQEAGRDDEEIKPFEEEKVNETAGANSEVIELSDIAIGITPEDDAIVELTEEVIGEALNGFAGAVREVMRDGEEDLDLSETEVEIDEFDQAVDTVEAEPDDHAVPVDMEEDTLEEDISKELDDYFETEMETEKIKDTIPSEPILLEIKDEITDDKVVDKFVVSESDVEAALERVVKKMYSEKINRLLDKVIETKLSNEIDRFKEYLIGALKK
ncbi:MAG: hypothetical protein ACKVE4_01040 [Dissulfuribacterales bacterium]